MRLSVIAVVLLAVMVAGVPAGADPPVTSYELVIRRGVAGDTYRFDDSARTARDARPAGRHIEFILLPPLVANGRPFGRGFPREGILFRYSFAEGRARIDDPANNVSVLFRCATHSVLMLDHAHKTYWSPLVPRLAMFEPGAEKGNRVDIRTTTHAAAAVEADVYDVRLDRNAASDPRSAMTMDMTFWLLRDSEPSHCGNDLSEMLLLASDPAVWYGNLVYLMRAEGAIVSSAGPQIPNGRFALYTRLAGLDTNGLEDAIVFERGNIGREPLPAAFFQVPPDYH